MCNEINEKSVQLTFNDLKMSIRQSFGSATIRRNKKSIKILINTLWEPTDMEQHAVELLTGVGLEFSSVKAVLMHGGRAGGFVISNPELNDGPN